MKTGNDITEFEEFVQEATEILEDAKSPVRKLESNVKELNHEPNPKKKWNKRGDTIWKKHIVSQRHISKALSTTYDSLGILSPTMVKVKKNRFIGSHAMKRSVGFGRYLLTPPKIRSDGDVN